MEDIAAMGDLPVETLDENIHDLKNRGIIQKQGKNMMIQPRIFTANLAERQWDRWNQEKWDHVLTGNHRDLRVAAAKQLALLNTRPISKKVVERVCRYNGLFDDLPRLVKTRAEMVNQGFSVQPSKGQMSAYLDVDTHAEVLSSLAEIDREIVAEQIERVFDDIPDLGTIDGSARRHVVRAVEKIAFDPDTFDTGAWLMLRLGMAENETWSNNATGQFQKLFPVVLANTAADGNARLAFLDDVSATSDLVQLKMVVEALFSAFRRDHYRIVGPESPGTASRHDTLVRLPQMRERNTLRGA